MNNTQTKQRIAPDRFRTLAAQASGCPPERLRTAHPLSEQGIHGPALIRFLRSLVHELGRVPPDRLLQSPFALDDLAAWASAGPAPDAEPTPIARMLLDTELAADIRPSAAASPGPHRYALLTGATGFVGPNLVEALLADPAARVCCLVRGDGPEAARERLIRHLHDRSLWQAGWDERLDVVAGDVCRPRLGLDEATFDHLATEVDAVYHAAAEVNWAKTYAKLRRGNVEATEEVLRFATAGQAKRFIFLSSTAVCHSTTGPSSLTERDEVTPYLRGVHLGYAQSKWVAEQLVREAGARGLPVIIHRAPFVAGDTRDALANGEDLPARLLSACVAAGRAPDSDWPMDACPADFLARALVWLSRRAGPAAPIHHLRSPTLTDWRQLLLCMNLYGYRIRLTDYDTWLAHVRPTWNERRHALRPLKPLFAGRPLGPEAPTMAELLQRRHVSHADDAATRRLLAEEGLHCPELRPGLVKRYIRHFVATDVFPSPASSTSDADPETDIERHIQAALDACNVPLVGPIEHIAMPGAESIVTELGALVRGQPAGLYPLRVRWACDGGEAVTREVLVKIKASDATTLTVAGEIVALEDPALAAEYHRIKGLLPFNRGHIRESAIYSLAGDAVRAHMPHLYGATVTEPLDGAALVLESLADAERLGHSTPLTPSEMSSALRCLATLHADWLGQTQPIANASWLPPIPDTSQRLAMQAFWARLGDTATAFIQRLAEPGLVQCYHRLLRERPQWLADDEVAPHTVIHNDFNPRNLAFRHDASAPDGLRCYAYDWELATLGLPQRDLAELLCFGLEPADVSADRVAQHVHGHRRALEARADVRLPAESWVHGFRHAMRELLVERLALYTLVDTVDRQRFLPRVLRTWYAIYHVLGKLR